MLFGYFFNLPLNRFEDKRERNFKRRPPKKMKDRKRNSCVPCVLCPH